MAGPKLFSIFFNYPELKNSKNNIVLIGEVGSGKTTLFNKLTGYNFETDKNCSSVTKDVHAAEIDYFDGIIIDIPGFNDDEDVYKTFELQYRSIRNIPIKTILFVVERRDRISQINKILNDFKVIFENYLDNIIVVITKTEELDNDKKSFFIKKISEKTSLEKIIFSNNNVDSITIMNKIGDYQRNMNILKEVSPNTIKFAQDFKNISDNNVNIIKNKFLKEFNNALEIFDKQFDSSQDKALKRALYFTFRDYKNNLIEKFYDKVKKEKAISDDIIENVLAFSRIIYSDFDKFREKAEKEMEIILTNYKGEENRFKKCPYCKLVWFKITGCDGKVKCGNRDKIKDKFYGYYKDYKVKFENNKLEITKFEEEKLDTEKGDEFTGLTEEEILENKKLKEKGKPLIRPLGCGSWISWNEMEDVTDSYNNLLQEIPNND